jgi:glycosyltransferase involved in cell wall biosynthesis
MSMRFADRVLADTEPQAEYFAGLAGIARSKVAVVPVGADERLFSAVRPPSSPDVARCEVLFYGTMIPLHGVDTILDAARLLADAPQIHFHLVGEGQVPLERLLAENPIASVRWTRRLSYAELPTAIAAADLCLGIFGTSDKAARVVPHKVYEAAAMGKAIVTADTPAMRAAFPEGSLMLVPPGNPQALADAIRALAVAPVRRSQMGAAVRAQFQAAYTTPAIGAALAAALP